MHQFTHASGYLCYSTFHGLQYTCRYTCTVDIDHCHFTCISSHQYRTQAAKVSKKSLLQLFNKKILLPWSNKQTKNLIQDFIIKSSPAVIVALHQHQQSSINHLDLPINLFVSPTLPRPHQPPIWCRKVQLRTIWTLWITCTYKTMNAL